MNYQQEAARTDMYLELFRQVYKIEDALNIRDFETLKKLIENSLTLVPEIEYSTYDYSLLDSKTLIYKLYRSLSVGEKALNETISILLTIQGKYNYV